VSSYADQSAWQDSTVVLDILLRLTHSSWRVIHPLVVCPVLPVLRAAVSTSASACSSVPFSIPAWPIQMLAEACRADGMVKGVPPA
jgi:hypothetical protein